MDIGGKERGMHTVVASTLNEQCEYTEAVIDLGLYISPEQEWWSV